MSEYGLDGKCRHREKLPLNEGGSDVFEWQWCGNCGAIRHLVSGLWSTWVLPKEALPVGYRLADDTPLGPLEGKGVCDG